MTEFRFPMTQEVQRVALQALRNFLESIEVGLEEKGDDYVDVSDLDRVLETLCLDRDDFREIQQTSFRKFFHMLHCVHFKEKIWLSAGPLVIRVLTDLINLMVDCIELRGEPFDLVMVDTSFQKVEQFEPEEPGNRSSVIEHSGDPMAHADGDKDS